MRGPIVPVVVIGPYRSGKSFTLNQLMEVPCDEGFGVGHSRHTQTKGIWVWGEPLQLKTDDGETLNRDSESDLEKLSFAAELAKAFYGTNRSNTVQPTSMIWLIQRDFLEGDSLQETLEKALRRVPNPHKDSGIAQLNHIREGLEKISKSSTAIGLPQPHLDRTKLCDLDEKEFDPHYVKQRDRLRNLTVTALNEREIPTAGSLVYYFNKDLVAKCKDMYVDDMSVQQLPMEESEIRSRSDSVMDKVLQVFDRDRFGTDVDDLKGELSHVLDEELQSIMSANELASTKVYPRTFIGTSSSMFETQGWKMVTKAWEAVVDNPIVDLQAYGLPLVAVFLVLYVARARIRRLMLMMRTRMVGRRLSKRHGPKIWMYNSSHCFYM
eukprot:jgi/Picre1/28482/NNA_003886.t1